jgi:hypothetical protein
MAGLKTAKFNQRTKVSSGLYLSSLSAINRLAQEETTICLHERFAKFF